MVRKKGTIRSRIKRGDDVVFVAGKEFNRYQKGESGVPVRVPYRGKVIAVDSITGRVKVEGAMIVSKHQKAVPQMNVEGGIKKREAWVDVSNVSLIDPETDRPTRVRYEIREGGKVRVAKSGAVIPEPGIFASAEVPKKEADASEGETEEEAGSAESAESAEDTEGGSEKE